MRRLNLRGEGGGCWVYKLGIRATESIYNLAVIIIFSSSVIRGRICCDDRLGEFPALTIHEDFMSDTDDDTDGRSSQSSSATKAPSLPASSIRRPRRLRPPLYKRVRYTHILNSYIHESRSLTDSLTRLQDSPFPLRDSTILNTLWTTDEKDRFFTALARCGKGNLAEVARRVGSKSLVEVSAYVGVLEEEMTIRKLRPDKLRRLYDYSTMPAAVEVDDQWIALEEKMAAAMGKSTDDETTAEESPNDEDMLLNVDKANELAIWYIHCYYNPD